MSLPRVLFILTLIVVVALLSLVSFDLNEVDQGLGHKLTRSKASLGSKSDQYDLAVMYDKGDGVERSESQAVALYEKAAIQGVGDAQFALGMCLFYGRVHPTGSGRTLTMPEPETKHLMLLLVQLIKGTA